MSIVIEIVNKLGFVQRATRDNLQEAILFARSYSCQRNIELVTFEHAEDQYTAREGAIYVDCAVDTASL